MKTQVKKASEKVVSTWKDLTIEQVVNSIKSAESSEKTFSDLSNQFNQVKITNEKNILDASMKVYAWVVVLGNSQADLARAGVSNGSITRYLSAGMLVAKLGIEKLTKANITPNAISNAVNSGLTSKGALDKVNSISELKIELTPNHPSKKKGTTRKSKKTKSASVKKVSTETIFNTLADLALNGSMTRETWKAGMFQVEKSFTLRIQNLQKK